VRGRAEKYAREWLNIPHRGAYSTIDDLLDARGMVFHLADFIPHAVLTRTAQAFDLVVAREALR
jgi:hypothetical protein